MTKPLDKLQKTINKTGKRTGTYGCCKRCGKPNEGGMSIRFQTTLYETQGSKTQKGLWSRARGVCRDCAAEAIETVLEFLGEKK